MTAALHKIDQKTSKSVISGLHFTTFVNIFPKLRYFEGRNVIQIGYKSYSVLLFSQETYERWGHLPFAESGRILEKGGGGVDLEKGGMTPFTNYELLRFFTSYIQSAFLPVTVFFILVVR